MCLLASLCYHVRTDWDGEVCLYKQQAVTAVQAWALTHSSNNLNYTNNANPLY